MSFIALIPIGFLLLFLLTLIFAGIWVYRDAKAHGENGAIWLLVVILVPNFLGLLLYFLVVRRDPKIRCEHCGRYTSEREPYCGYCGEAIHPRRKDKSHNKFAYMALGTFILGIVLLIGFFIFAITKQYNFPDSFPNFTRGVTVVQETGNNYLSVAEDGHLKYDFGNLNGETEKVRLLRDEIEDGLTIISDWKEGQLSVIFEADDGVKTSRNLVKGKMTILPEELPEKEFYMVYLLGKDAVKGNIELFY